LKKRVIDDSGFLGSHLSDRLPERGHRVIGLISQLLDAMVVLTMDWLGLLPGMLKLGILLLTGVDRHPVLSIIGKGAVATLLFGLCSMVLLQRSYLAGCHAHQVLL
jgi:hypothetical protein